MYLIFMELFSFLSYLGNHALNVCQSIASTDLDSLSFRYTPFRFAVDVKNIPPTTAIEPSHVSRVVIVIGVPGAELTSIVI